MAQTERVPITEAAARLGVSVITVRRRLKAGELAGERQQTASGFVWLVDVPVSEGPVSHAPDLAAQAPHADVTPLAVLEERAAGLERLVAELRQERDDWREQARREGEANREMRVLVQQAQAMTRALPAETVDGVPRAADQPRTQEVITRTQSWWKRLFTRTQPE